MPKAVKIRPTKDRVKESLFGILGDFVCGKTVLDLFAGSGAFGMEALSRGACRAVFIEKDGRCVGTIKENLRSLGIGDDIAPVIRADALKAAQELELKKERFDLILLDPPYHKDLAKKCLIKIDRHDILKTRCVIAVEHHKADAMPDMLNNITNYRTVCYSDVCLSFYRAK